MVLQCRPMGNEFTLLYHFLSTNSQRIWLQRFILKLDMLIHHLHQLSNQKKNRIKSLAFFRTHAQQSTRWMKFLITHLPEHITNIQNIHSTCVLACVSGMVKKSSSFELVAHARDANIRKRKNIAVRSLVQTSSSNDSRVLVEEEEEEVEERNDLQLRGTGQILLDEKSAERGWD